MNSPGFVSAHPNQSQAFEKYRESYKQPFLCRARRAKPRGCSNYFFAIA